MTPVDRYDALRALQEGIKAALTAAEADLRAYRRETRAGNFDAPHGKISFTARKPLLDFDPDGLLAWAIEHAPHEVIPEHTVTVPPAVRDTLRTSLAGRMVPAGDDVVDTVTGEIVPWARVVPAGPDIVRFVMPAAEKAAVSAQVAARLDALAQAALPPGPGDPQ